MRQLMRQRLVPGLRLWGLRLRLRLMRWAADEGGCCERLWRAADAANAAGVTASGAAEAPRSLSSRPSPSGRRSHKKNGWRPDRTTLPESLRKEVQAMGILGKWMLWILAPVL